MGPAPTPVLTPRDPSLLTPFFQSLTPAPLPLSPRRMEHPTAAETAANAATDIAPPTGWAAVKRKDRGVFWEVEEHLADIFGLNDSKYQFAIDEYMQKKQEEEDRAEYEAWEREQEEAKENERLAAEADALEGGGDGFEEVRLTSEAGKEGVRASGRLRSILF